MKKVLKYILYIGICLYTILCIALYLFQDQLIFDPDPLPDSHTFRDGVEVEIPVSGGHNLNCLFLNRSSSDKAILYLHGNRGNNRRCLRQVRTFDQFGYDILIPDYRGYGKSSGSVYSEEQLLGDAQKAYNYLKDRYDESNIIVVGYSLGTGMASYIASQNNPKHLVLVAPYLSLIDMKNRYLRFVPDFLLKYPLDNEHFLSKALCPITVFHGTNDEVIPYHASVQLKKKFETQLELVTLRGTSHRRSIFHDQITHKLRSILRSQK